MGPQPVGLKLIPLWLCAASASALAAGCSEQYYKISNEASGLASSCAAVEQPADPVTNLDEAGCFAACDALPGCNTVNYRTSDPNFGGNSTCYRKACDDFKVAACTLFTNHKGREVYTKACGTKTLWHSAVMNNADGLFAGVSCSLADEVVSNACASEAGTTAPVLPSCVEGRYYKISNEASGLATSCGAVDQTADPIVNYDEAGCFAACDALPGCNTVNYRVSDPNFGGNSTCYRKACNDFKVAACTLFTKHKGRHVYTKAELAPSLWQAHIVRDGDGLFAGINCPSEISATCAVEARAESTPKSCAQRYFKISNEANGLATSCAAVDQAADPIINMDEAGCFAACDSLPGCTTVNYRVSDPNFGGNSTCYRKACSDFGVAACTLFTKHKGRDVYTKACGAQALWSNVALRDDDGVFAGVSCPAADVVASACSAEREAAPAAPLAACAERYYKVSNEASGLGATCSAVSSAEDPLVNLGEAACFAACDAQPGCTTVNYRVSNPNFGGNSTCYRKACSDFKAAACALRSEGQGHGVYTKACGGPTLWRSSVLTDSHGLFAGMDCDALGGPAAEGNTGEGTGKCTRWATTNKDQSSCDICWERDDDEAADTLASCQLWEKMPLSSSLNATRCMQMSESSSERQEREANTAFVLQSWPQVGLCNQKYIPGTSDCSVVAPEGHTCEVRDQPCHGGTGLPGVAGVLSPGWQMSFDTELKHVCTMCPKGTYGHCDNACKFRSRFFWSGHYAGQMRLSVSSGELMQLYKAFVAEQPEETEELPQPLEISVSLRERLPGSHPLRTSSTLAASTTPFSIISVGEVLVTGREEVKTMAQTAGNRHLELKLSPSGVKVYLTCECETCPRGRYQDRQGTTGCSDCNELIPGSNTRDIGASRPGACECLAEDERFLDNSGNTSRCLNCTLVHRGEAKTTRGQCPCALPDTYELESEDGSVTCERCPEHSTTFDPPFQGHKPPRERMGKGLEVCQCKPGYSYFGGGPNQQGKRLPGRCSACSAGLQCPGDTSLGLQEQPYVLPGFWADEAWGVFQCRDLGAAACPGGKPLQCLHGRTGRACNLCPENFVADDEEEGVCEACANTGEWKLLLFALLWTCIAGVFTVVWNRRGVVVEAAESVVASSTVGLLVSFVQVSVVFMRLNVQWPPVVERIFSSLAFLFFDPTALRLECAGLGSSLSKYIASSLTPLLACIAFFFWQFLSLPLRKCTGAWLPWTFPRLSWHESFNSTGMFMLGMLVSIACLVVSFVDCTPNPNGDRTLRNYNDVICGSPQHMSMMPAFIFGVLFYICACIAVLVWLIIVAPNRFSDPNFRVLVRFLVFKFRPEAYWFSFPHLFRALAFAMVSVIVPDHAFLQCVVMLFIIASFGSLHLIYEPYSSLEPNVLEGIELFILLTIVVAGMWFIDTEQAANNPALSNAVTVMVVCLISLCFLTLLLVVLFTGVAPFFFTPQRQQNKVRGLVKRLLAACALLVSKDPSEVEALFQRTHYVNRRTADQHACFLFLELANLRQSASRMQSLPITVQDHSCIGRLCSLTVDEIKNDSLVRVRQEENKSKLRDGWSQMSSLSSLCFDAVARNHSESEPAQRRGGRFHWRNSSSSQGSEHPTPSQQSDKGDVQEDHKANHKRDGWSQMSSLCHDALVGHWRTRSGSQGSEHPELQQSDRAHVQPQAPIVAPAEIVHINL